MDTALILKKELDTGTVVSDAEAISRLNNSELVSLLTDEIIDKPLFYIWRLIALSEIPKSSLLDYTSQIIDRIYDKLSTPFGFSLSGDEKMFLPCYNAMIVTAMCRLGRAGDKEVENAVNWINTYQPMERGIKVSSPNLNFDRYGGCFKDTPCYIGLAKSVIALYNYQISTNKISLNTKLEQGIEYLLRHHLIRRLSYDRPITNRILDISFPESYNLNIVELIRFAAQANLLGDNRTQQAVDYLNEKRTKEGCWKISYRYKSEGYIVFDRGRDCGEWVSYIISQALDPK